MDKNKVIEAAAKLIAKGQLDKAAKEFQRALDFDPDDVRILQKLAELDQKMGRHAEAADCFERVAKTYAAQGFYLKAVALYKQVLKVVERIEVNIKLAELYQQLGLLGDATKEWQAVSAHYEKVGDLKSALDTLKKLVELDPDNVAARIRLGEQYARQDNFVEAVTELRRAAEYLKKHGRTDDYLRVAERISHLDQGDATLARELAESYLGRGDAKRALAKLQICFKANPRDLQTLEMLARAFEELGQINKTVSVLKELGRLHFDAGRKDDARRVFEHITELAPEDADVKAMLRQIITAQSGNAAKKETTSPGFLAPGARRSGPGRPGSRPKSGSTLSVPPPAPPLSQPAIATIASEMDRLSGTTSQSAPVAARGLSAPPPPPGPPQSSNSIPKLLKETDVYVKYGLHEKALEHLSKIFALDPDSTEAHEKAKTLALAMKRPADAAESLAKLVRLYSARSDPRADAAKAELRKLDPKNPALQLSAKLGPFPTARVAIESDPFEEKTRIDPPRGRPVAVEEYGADESGEVTIADVLHQLDISGPLPVPRSPPPGKSAPNSASPITQPIDPAVYAAEADLEAEEFVEEAEEVGEHDTQPQPLNASALGDEDPFASDLAEADFYIDAGLGEDARAILEGILLAEPSHAAARKRLAQLSPEESPDDTQESPPTLLDARPISPRAGNALIAEDLAQAVGAQSMTGEGAPLDVQRLDLMNEVAETTGGTLRSQVHEAIRREDAQTHYDLGIAYKEMGLLDDAIAEFELALQFGGGVRKIDCITILAVCAMEKGRPQDSVAVLRRALEEPGLNPPALRALAYELGQAYEALGDRGLAIEQYKAIERSERGFRDAAARIQRLGGSISTPLPTNASGIRPVSAPIQNTPAPSGDSSASGTRPTSAPIRRPAPGLGKPSAPPKAPPVAPPATSRDEFGEALGEELGAEPTEGKKSESSNPGAPVQRNRKIGFI